MAADEELSSVNVDSEESAVVASSVFIREVHRRELIDVLLTEGYLLSSGPGVYAHGRKPDFRIRFGKTVVRLEIRAEDGHWLGRSYLLTKDHAHVMHLFKDPDEMLRTSLREQAVHCSRISPAWAQELEVRNYDLGRETVESSS